MMYLCPSVLAISSAPNASIVEGMVVKVGVLVSTLENIEPDMDIYELVIEVSSSQPGDEPFPSPVKPGQRITVLTKEHVSQEVLRRKIRARVSYRGDERGGGLWLSSLEVMDGPEH